VTDPDLRVRVLVADDHARYRQGIEVVLSLDDSINVVGLASDGQDAVDRCAYVAPDVILMDVRMPGLGGIDATQIVTARHPQVKVVMLSMSDDENDLYAALLAGAIGYVLKDRPAEVIAAAVHSAHRGEPILTPGVAARALSALGLGSPALSHDEHEAMARLARGQSLAEAAARMDMTTADAATLIVTALSRLRRTPLDG